MATTIAEGMKEDFIASISQQLVELYNVRNNSPEIENIRQLLRGLQQYTVQIDGITKRLDNITNTQKHQFTLHNILNTSSGNISAALQIMKNNNTIEELKKTQLQLKDELYHYCMEISAAIQRLMGDKSGFNQDTNSTDYAVYYEVSIQGFDKKMMVRKRMPRVGEEFLNYSKSNKAIRISASKVRHSDILKARQNDEQDAKQFELANQKRLMYIQYIDDVYNALFGVISRTYRGSAPIPNGAINIGHLTEATERYLQEHAPGLSSVNYDDDESMAGLDIPSSPSDISAGEAWYLVQASRGTAPWYTGGDVGSTQVKFVGKGNVRLTKDATLFDISLFYISLLEPLLTGRELTPAEIQSMARNVAQVVFSDETPNFDKLGEVLDDQTLEMLHQEIEKRNG